MNPDEQHKIDWEKTKSESEEMLKSTNNKIYEQRIKACDRLLATIK